MMIVDNNALLCQILRNLYCSFLLNTVINLLAECNILAHSHISWLEISTV